MSQPDEQSENVVGVQHATDMMSPLFVSQTTSSSLLNRTASASSTTSAGRDTEPSIPNAIPATSTAHSSTATQLLLPDILNQLRLVPNQPLIKLPLDDYPNPFQLQTSALQQAVIPSSTTPSSHRRMDPSIGSAAATIFLQDSVAKAVSSVPSTSAALNHLHHLGASTSTATAEDTLHDQLFGPKCSGCRFAHVRRTHVKSAEHSILHPTQFKQRIGLCTTNSGSAITTKKSTSATHDQPQLPHNLHHSQNRRRSTILRQPQLRLLQQCLQHGLTQSCANLNDRFANYEETPTSSTAPSASATSTPLHRQATAAPMRSSMLQDRLVRCLRRPTSSAGRLAWNTTGLLDRSFADFRSLVSGCESLSLSVGSVSEAAHKAARLPLSFRQLQQQTHNHAYVPRPRRSMAGTISQSSTFSTLSSSSLPWKGPRSRSSEDLRSGRHRTNHHHHHHHHHHHQHNQQQQRPHHHQATCSQQAKAGNGSTTTAAAAAESDVSIDELASYFETFVHIPKKMSTMAEMMYI